MILSNILLFNKNNYNIQVKMVDEILRKNITIHHTYLTDFAYNLK